MGTGSPRVGGGLLSGPPSHTPLLRSHTRAPHQAPGHHPALPVVRPAPSPPAAAPGLPQPLPWTLRAAVLVLLPPLCLCWARPLAPAGRCLGHLDPGEEGVPTCGLPHPSTHAHLAGWAADPRAPAAPGGLTHPVPGLAPRGAAVQPPLWPRALWDPTGRGSGGALGHCSPPGVTGSSQALPAPADRGLAPLPPRASFPFLCLRLADSGWPLARSHAWSHASDVGCCLRAPPSLGTRAHPAGRAGLGQRGDPPPLPPPPGAAAPPAARRPRASPAENVQPRAAAHPVCKSLVTVRQPLFVEQDTKG
ncbi:uncharacterized protein [Vulpes vulpes]|uniref:Uncharacterized protein n=1 Tax=Vulpes vulpes TaxID=9627 RepID=A0ABM4XAL5_VULVU